MRLIQRPLFWAKTCERPSSIKKNRVRGRKALGVRFENSLAGAMPWATQGQWFEFADRNGKSFCQTDILWDAGHVMVIVEVKHSWVEEGPTKLCWLYRPVVEETFDKPAICLIACKNVVPGLRHVYGKLDEALGVAMMSSRVVPTFQWLGASIKRPQIGRVSPVDRRWVDGQTLSP